MGEAEVITRIEEFRVRKGRRYVPLTEKRGDKRRLHHEENKLRKKEEERLQKRLEEQGNKDFDRSCQFPFGSSYQSATNQLSDLIVKSFSLRRCLSLKVAFFSVTMNIETAY